MPKTEFQIQSPAGFLINGEYQGNTDSRKIIIFSHGFGVTRKARGLFDDIAAILKDKYLCVLFDYNLKLENSIKVDSISEQAEILKAVYKHLKHEFGWFECSLVGHSLGTIIIGLADLPDISKIILLAGSPSNPYNRLLERFNANKANQIDQNGTSLIKRADGSNTLVEKEFWTNLKCIPDPYLLYQSLSRNSNVTYVRATLDRPLIDREYKKLENITNLKYVEIEANHDFEVPGRKHLLNKLKEIF